MKLKSFIATMLLVCFVASKSNAKINFVQITWNVTYNSIYVATNKTTTLLFPASIKSCTVGCENIHAEKIEGTGNGLQVKACVENFSETNMTVVTVDGSIYSFLVNYSVRPLQLVFTYDRLQEANTVLEDEVAVKTIKKTSSMEADIKATATQLSGNKKRLILGLHDRNAGMVLKLRGIHEKNKVLYFQLECQNHTDQDYVIDTMQFYIKDQYKNVLNFFQQVAIKPLLVLGNHSNIKAKTNEMVVVATTKFMIPYLKYFAISLNEKNKEGQLLIKIRNDELIDARLIHSLTPVN